MPILSPEDIARKIECGEITSLSIDTSQFEANKNGLEYGYLKRIEQFKGSNIKVVVSDVVVQEVLGHMKDAAVSSESAVRKALKSFGDTWQFSRPDRDRVIAGLLRDKTSASITEERWAGFVGRTSLEVVRPDGIPISQLTELYFGLKAPFSSAKKAEFPDAIALLTLEKWAEENGTLMLVASGDGDWAAYCQGSQRLVCVPTLKDLLQHFNKNLSVFCNVINRLVLHDGHAAIHAGIEAALENEVPDMEVIPEWDSAFSAEEEVSSVSLTSFSFITDSNGQVFDPVEREEDVTVISATVEISVDVEATFSFSVKDPIDRDYVSMGHGHGHRSLSTHADIILTLSGDDPEHVDVEEIEVVLGSLYVDFGEVEPDWMTEDYEE